MELRRKVLGMDPTGTGTGDEMGVVLVGATADAHQYVIGTTRGSCPGWHQPGMPGTMLSKRRRLPGR